MIGCDSTLTLGPSPLNVDGACDVVALTVCDNAPAPCTLHEGTLTPNGHASARLIAAALVGVALQPRYGCPDCADGGASALSLFRNGAASEHVYEFGNPPPVLANADVFVQGLITALRQCQSTPDIDVAPNCVPRNQP